MKFLKILKRKFFRKKVRPLSQKAPSKRRILLKHKGKHFHLKEIYDAVNAQYFESKLDLHITWFGGIKSKARRSIRLGSYHQGKNLIKISRKLDQSHIPHHFISFVVYHEMLHHVLPPRVEKNCRRQIHHRDFREKEKQFQEYALVQEVKGKLF